MATAPPLTDDITVLRKCVRDLASLSALPTTWTRYTSSQILENLADELVRVTAVDCLYLRVGGDGSSIISARSSSSESDAVDRVCKAVESFIASGRPLSDGMPDPIVMGRMLRVVMVPLGDQSDVLLAASSRPGFPTEAERLLLEVGAAEAQVILQRVAVENALGQSQIALRERNRKLETVGAISRMLAAELDLQKLVQAVTDAVTDLTGAQFGAFFYNEVNEKGEAYLLYALSGAPREAFASFTIPRNTELFEPTFRGEGTVRLDDVRRDPRFGTNAPFRGLPPDHLPVVSYLAVPVISRSGAVLGGLFLGHPEVGVFGEEEEKIVLDIASHAAIAIDNARLFEAGQRARETALREQTRLQKSEERHRVLFESSPHATFVFDAETLRFLSANEAALKLYGYSEEEFLSLGLLDIRPAEDVPLAREIVAHLPSSGQVIEVRKQLGVSEAHRHRRKDGRVLFVEPSVQQIDFNGRRAWLTTIVDVTERKKAEQAGALLAAIVESSDDAIISKDLHGIITSWNEGARRLFGYTAGEAIGQPVTMLIPPDRLHEEPAILERLQRGERVEHFEAVRLRKDGTALDISLTISPVRDAAGRITGASKVARNIAERKRAEDALQESEKKFSILFEKAAFGAALAKLPDGVLIDVNEAFVNMFGFTREEALGKTSLELGINPDSELGERLLAELQQRGFVRDQEMTLYTKSGEARTFLNNITEIELGGQKHLLTTIQDITERRAAEVLVDSQRQALKLLAEGAPLEDVLGFLLGVVDHHSDEGMLAAITPLNQAGTHFQRGISASLPDAFNAAVEGVPVSSPTGLCAQAVTRREAVAVHDFNADAAWQPFGTFVAPYGLRSGWSVPIISPGGQVLGTFANYYRHAGDPTPQNRDVVDMVVRTAAIAIERRRLEADAQAAAIENARLYEQSEAANRAKEDFFAMLSHELRTPLTSVLGWAGLLARAPDAATVAEGARAIASSASLQAQLVDDLLDVSRMMTGKLGMTRADADLRMLVDETLALHRPAAAAKGVALRHETPPSIVVSGDPTRLRQVIGNLLSNAIKFTPPGGVVEIRLQREGSSAIVTVSDTGEGIPPEFLPHLFERFAQRAERRHGGLGLGLAIVKHIIEQHGGSVVARSPGEGKGSTFTVRLPAARG